MTRRILSLDTLKILDAGRPYIAFQSELQKAIADCTDNPRETALRKVTMVIALKPTYDVIEEGDGRQRIQPTGAVMSMTAKASLPQKQTKSYDLALDRDNQLAFQELVDEEEESEVR